MNPEEATAAASAKASEVGRMTNRLMLGAENGFHPLILMGYSELLAKSATELADILREAPPGTSVHMDPQLPDSALRAIADGIGAITPDTIPDDWTDD